jgi:hypothetical protein
MRAVRSLEYRPEPLKDPPLGLGVDRGEGIVQDEDPGVTGEGTGQGGTLSLAAREVDAALAQAGLVAVGEAANGFVELGDGGRGADGGHDVRAVVFQAEGDILRDGLAEEERVLGDEADGPGACRGTARGGTPSRRTDALGWDRRVGQERHHGGLPGACGAHQRDRAAGRDPE